MKGFRVKIGAMNRSGEIIKDNMHYLENDKLFDASQYAFFGRPTTEKIEFGCLEEDEDNPSTGVLDDECHLFDREELNKSVSRPRHPGVIGDRGSGSISRESSSASVDLLEWLDQHISDIESSHGCRRCSSQSHLPSDPKPLYRASSYPTEKH
ncbi:unnamed protein product [Lactuca saligna]|uniref:Uncharacterized protein n=1 Tax=Lactuca saligna TaxID=75948 RepID=A0AA36EE70_LACSI|nr:unnamed protein product [Lactuca saligna]